VDLLSKNEQMLIGLSFTVAVSSVHSSVSHTSYHIIHIMLSNIKLLGNGCDNRLQMFRVAPGRPRWMVLGAKRSGGGENCSLAFLVPN